MTTEIRQGPNGFMELDSTNILGIRHHPGTEVLEVIFRSSPSTCYVYANVSGDHVRQMLAADSAGKWFYRNIREFPDLYPYRTYGITFGPIVRRGGTE